jgi:hypothetical protein
MTTYGTAVKDHPGEGTVMLNPSEWPLLSGSQAQLTPRLKESMEEVKSSPERKSPPTMTASNAPTKMTSTVGKFTKNPTHEANKGRRTPYPIFAKQVSRRNNKSEKNSKNLPSPSNSKSSTTMAMETVTEAESIKEDKVNSTATGGSTVDSMGNSRTMAPLPAPTAAEGNNSMKKINSTMVLAPVDNSTSGGQDKLELTADSTTMVLAPVVYGAEEPAPVVPAPMEGGMMVSLSVPEMEMATEAESIKEDSTVDSMGTNSNNNSMTMVVPGPAAHGESPAPMEGIMGQEEEGWNKVKPSKKKQNKVKWSKKRQKKLTFGKTPREPASAASKSGPMDADPQGIDSGTGGGNRPTEVDPTQGTDDITSAGNNSNKTVTMVTPPQEATKKRKSLEDDKEEGQEEGAVGMEVEEEKTTERGTPKQPPKSVKQTSEKFISIRQTKAMSQWYLACISNKIVQGLDRDVNLTEEDLKPGSEFYGWFQWACDYSTRDKVGDDKKTVLRDPNHWFQTLTKVPNGDDLRKSEDPAKRKAARNVLEVGIDLAWSPMELFKDQFVCDNRKFGLDPSEETAELVAARAAAYKFFGPVYQYKADLKSNGEVGVPVKVMRKVNAPKNSRRVDLAVNPDEAVTVAKRKALEDAEAAQSTWLERSSLGTIRSMVLTCGLSTCWKGRSICSVARSAVSSLLDACKTASISSIPSVPESL